MRFDVLTAVLKFLSSGVRRHIDQEIGPSVQDEPTNSLFRVKRPEKGSIYFARNMLTYLTDYNRTPHLRILIILLQISPSLRVGSHKVTVLHRLRVCTRRFKRQSLF